MHSYRKKHVKNKISRIKPKKSVFKKLWFWILVFVLLAVCVAAYFFFFYPGIQVKNIIISGNEKIKTGELHSLIQKNASTGLINFWQIKITSQSIFLVDLNKLNREILEKFPIIERINLSKDFPQTITLGVVERNPIGTYCSSQEQCFLIDQNGIIFEPVSVAFEDVTIVRQALESGQISTGQKVVAQNIITAIYKIQKSLKDNFQINVANALVSSPLRLDVKTSENWQIYFNLDDDSDIDLQLTKLNLLLNGEISYEDRKNLRYINLIPKDRAIICDNSICAK